MLVKPEKKESVVKNSFGMNYSPLFLTMVNEIALNNTFLSIYSYFTQLVSLTLSRHLLRTIGSPVALVS